MKAIVAEAAHFVYFARTDPPLLETALGLNVELAPPFMESWLRGATDFRLMLQRGVPGDNRALVYYLHWDNGQDLSLLDQRIQSDTYAESDFAHSIKTVYQHTVCDGCHRSWPTLVAPTGDPYDGAPDLAHRKLREHVFIKHCPECGTHFRQLVAKILVKDLVNTKVADPK